MQRLAAERALACALSKGGDFAEIFYEDTLTNNLTLIGGQMDAATTLRLHGAGIRIYNGLSSVYVHTSDTSEPGLIKAARQAADAVNQTAANPVNIVLAAEQAAPNIHPVVRFPKDTPGARKAQLMRAAYSAAKSEGDLISQVQVSLADADQSVTVVNTDGLYRTDRRVRTRIAINAVASKDGENQLGNEAPGALCGYELFEDKVDVEASARQAARTALIMLSAEECPAGEMPVAIDGGFGGVIFHEACGHSLEATSVALGNSEMCGKLNQKIASDVVTAIDDGTIVGAWGSTNMDDEGMDTGRLVLIENGILKNYMIDRLNARRMGMPLTGSARRQSYAFEPTSRMRNTFIAPGSSTDEEIISSMGDGLYAARMGGGSVNPVTGEFNFAVSEGYLVRDGKIAKPVRGATLVGKGQEVLMRIDRVGGRLTLAEGVCGSSSGAVPTCVGQPMILVSRMTVGGRK